MPIEGNATLATDKLRLATAATRISVARTILPGPGGAGVAVIAGDGLRDAFSPVDCAPEIASAGCAASGVESFSLSPVRLLPPKVSL